MAIFEKLIQLEKTAAEFGFKWETANQIISQIESEVTEVTVHLKDNEKTKLQEEIGDLLHAVFSLCVFCKLDPQETLTNSVNKFERRFKAVQQLAADEGLKTLSGQSFDKLMLLWDQAKQKT